MPFIIGFELPLQRVADASFDASAHAEAGAMIMWNLGDYHVLWNPIEGWSADAGEPGLLYKTTVSGEAQFNGAANFGLVPTLTANLDSFFTTNVEFSAMLHATVDGSTSSKTICADVNYAVIADGSATLEISIPWVDIDESWTWSETWFTKFGTIAKTCVGAKARRNSDASEPLLAIAPPPPQPKKTKQPPAAPVLPKGAPKKQSPPPVQQISVHPGPYGPTKNLQGKQAGCFNNRGYAMAYNLTMEESYNLLDLATFQGFDKLQCNAGGNNFRIEFEDDDSRENFFRMVQPYTTFLTGNLALSAQCHGMYDTTVFLFRVQHLKDTSIPFIKYQAEVEVEPSRYDEVFLHADLVMNPDDSVKCGAPNVARLGKTDHVCLGVNTNPACNAAKRPLAMYKGDHLTVDCTDCFFALKTDVFFELHVSYYWVKTLSGGFKNMTLDAAMVLDVISQMQWNSGTNITEDIVPPTTIVDFSIGPVPVRLWFEIPMRRLAEVQVNVSASVSAGALAQWNIGDYYVSYTQGKGWTHVAPRPTLVWQPFVSKAQVAFTASAVLGLIPTFAFHVDSVFWTTLTLDPEVTLEANGSLVYREACASAKAVVTATAYAELDFNIPFIYLHLGAWWGPEQVYNSGVKHIGSVCHKFSEQGVARLPKKPLHSASPAKFAALPQ